MTLTIGLISMSIDAFQDIHLKRVNWNQLMLGIFLVYAFIGCMLGGSGPNVNRINGIYFATFYALIVGIRTVYCALKKLPSIPLKPLKTIINPASIFAVMLIISYVLLASSFFHYYYTEILLV